MTHSLPMSTLLRRDRPLPVQASTRAPTEGRWPPGKTCSLMKSLLAQYASYRSSGSQMACEPSQAVSCACNKPEVANIHVRYSPPPVVPMDGAGLTPLQLGGSSCSSKVPVLSLVMLQQPGQQVSVACHGLQA